MEDGGVSEVSPNIYCMKIEFFIKEPRYVGLGRMGIMGISPRGGGGGGGEGGVFEETVENRIRKYKKDSN
jgi:hypothetical protein